MVSNLALVGILLTVSAKKLKIDLSQRQNFLSSVSWISYVKSLQTFKIQDGERFLDIMKSSGPLNCFINPQITMKKSHQITSLRKKIIFGIILLSSWSYIMCEFDPKCLICLNSEDWITHSMTGFLDISRENGS